MSLTKKFERYIPSGEHYANVIYLHNADGDWYQQQSKFKNDTLKILYNDDGDIISMHHDISMIYPENAYILELEANADIDINIHKVKDGKIYEYQSTTEYNKLKIELKKRQLINETSSLIAPLQGAVDIGTATNDEIERLKVLKEYQVSINRMLVINEEELPTIPV